MCSVPLVANDRDSTFFTYMSSITSRSLLSTHQSESDVV